MTTPLATALHETIHSMLWNDEDLLTGNGYYGYVGAPQGVNPTTEPRPDDVIVDGTFEIKLFAEKLAETLVAQGFATNEPTVNKS